MLIAGKKGKEKEKPVVCVQGNIPCCDTDTVDSASYNKSYKLCYNNCKEERQ
jgi:Icc-related predicted phosphoesterase